MRQKKAETQQFFARSPELVSILYAGTISMASMVYFFLLLSRYRVAQPSITKDEDVS